MASNEALAVAKKQGTLRYQIKKNKACYIMLAPYFILFFLFTVLPVLTSICLSFTYFNMLFFLLALCVIAAGTITSSCFWRMIYS